MSYLTLGAPPTEQERTLLEQEARRQLAAEVVKLTQKASERIDYLLNNEASLLEVISRFPLFVPNAYAARQSLIRARKDLFEKFRPIALSAIEDPSRNLVEVRDSVTGYLYNLEQQLKVVLQISDSQTLSSSIEAQFNRTIRWISDKAKKVSESVEKALDPAKSTLPWALAGAVGLLILIKR